MISVTDSRLDVTPAVDFNLPPVPARRSRELIVLAIQLLPTIFDDIEADLIEAFALALSEAEDVITVKDEIISASLTRLHQQQREIDRLKDRVVRLSEEQRAGRQVKPAQPIKNTAADPIYMAEVYAYLARIGR